MNSECFYWWASNQQPTFPSWARPLLPFLSISCCCGAEPWFDCTQQMPLWLRDPNIGVNFPPSWSLAATRWAQRGRRLPYGLLDLFSCIRHKWWDSMMFPNKYRYYVTLMSYQCNSLLKDPFGAEGSSLYYYYCFICGGSLSPLSRKTPKILKLFMIKHPMWNKGGVAILIPNRLSYPSE